MSQSKLKDLQEELVALKSEGQCSKVHLQKTQDGPEHPFPITVRCHIDRPPQAHMYDVESFEVARGALLELTSSMANARA